MAKTDNFIRYSLIAGVAVIACTGAYAAIRVGSQSRSYSNSYKNTLAVQQQYANAMAMQQAEQEAQQALVPTDLPVVVADENLAQQIRENTASVNVDTLDACSKIYPNGTFMWDVPTFGMHAGGEPTCVAVVEIRVTGQDKNSSYLPVARGKIAAGEIFKCNISEFRETDYLPDIARVVLPADAAPTREDVIAVMNEEQKQHAGLKIGAAALMTAIAGNMVGRNERGKDGIFGTNKEKLVTTGIGAVGGAALMAASTYSGKVAGDVILNTGVNAMAGGIIGNMAATGDDILHVEKCKGVDGVEYKSCLWGKISDNASAVKVDENTLRRATFYYDVQEDKMYECSATDGQDGDCSGGSCTETCRFTTQYTIDITIKNAINTLKGANKELNNSIAEIVKNYSSDKNRYTFTDDNKNKVKPDGSSGFLIKPDENNIVLVGDSIPAIIVNFPDKFFGIKYSKWEDMDKTGFQVMCRNRQTGDAEKCEDSVNKYATIENFTPAVQEAESGGVVDFSNRARLGATAKGAGIGGAIGGFAGYQGAQQEIEERLSLATQEYKGSLQKTLCYTGQKFLGFYNEEIPLPRLAK